MADVKWIKITTDMFDNRKIKHLRKLPEGNNIVLIWVMLLTMAGKCNAGGLIFLTENIPYTAKMLADELDFEETTVQLALKALEQLGMICTNNDLFLIPGWEKYQNVDGMERIKEQNRIRQKNWYDRQKKIPNVIPNVSVTLPNATEKEEEGEKEKNKSIKAEAFSPYDMVTERHFSPDLEQAVKSWISYKVEKRDGYKKTGLKSLLTAIENKAKEYGDKAVVDLIYLSESNNWKGIIWDRIKPETKQPAAKHKNRFNNFDQREYDMSDLEARLLKAQGTI